MGALDPTTASRLAKICGLFASDQMGERASAALQASALVKRAGCTWAEVIATAPAGNPRPRAATPRPAQGPTASAPGAHRAMAAWALRFPAELSSWEAGFLDNLRTRRRPASAKQASILAGIVDRLQKGGAV